MNSQIEPEQSSQKLQRKLKNSYATINLTLLSVIQGVALADLASVVAAEYKEFNILNWLLVVISFGLLIAVWNLYTIHSMIWDWVPDIGDAAIPFIIGALELALNHTITLNLGAWLIFGALLGIMASVAVWHAHWRASNDGENTHLLHLLGESQNRILHYVIVASFIVGVLGVTSFVLGLNASEGVHGWRGMLMLGFILLAAGCLVGAIYDSIRYWKHVRAFVRQDSMPTIILP